MQQKFCGRPCFPLLEHSHKAHWLKALCEQRREATTRKDGIFQSRAARCEARYDRCIRAASIDFGYAPVSPVIGLGTPMLQPYPTGKAQVNPGITAANAAKAGECENCEESPQFRCHEE